MDLLIFDCDGVLVDSEPLANEVLAETLSALGRPMTRAQSMRTQIGKSLADILRETAEIIGRPVPEQVGLAMNERLIQRFTSELRAIDGVAAALDALGQPRCLASSSRPERIEAALAATGLGGYFAHRFSATQVARGKPAPDLFLFAARQMGARPSETLVIEDSVAGVQAARAAGMPAIGFIGGGHADGRLGERLAAAGAACVIAHMRDLPGAVEALQSTRR